MGGAASSDVRNIEYSGDGSEVKIVLNNWSTGEQWKITPKIPKSGGPNLRNCQEHFCSATHMLGYNAEVDGKKGIVPYEGIRTEVKDDATKMRGEKGPQIGTEMFDMKKDADEYLRTYWKENKIKNKPVEDRISEVMAEIDRDGTWVPNTEELAYAAKEAWRNSPRCINRIQWKTIETRDLRDKVKSIDDAFNAVVEGLRYAHNGGALKSVLTCLPNRYRFWNALNYRYAGYKKKNGDIVGDPSTVEMTIIAKKLGWKGDTGGEYDPLPQIISDEETKEIKAIMLPDDMMWQVKIRHPRYPEFESLGMKWWAIPAISAFTLEVGGVTMRSIPFSGWYMSTEVARNLSDPQRYNKLRQIADLLKFDTKALSTLWMDRASIELNIAVLHSYQQDKVAMVDHHTASQGFMSWMKTEIKKRGYFTGDWIWMVPPISGHLSPIFHQEMINFRLKPYYGTQLEPFDEPHWKEYMHNIPEPKFKVNE